MCPIPPAPTLGINFPSSSFGSPSGTKGLRDGMYGMGSNRRFSGFMSLHISLARNFGGTDARHLCLRGGSESHPLLELLRVVTGLRRSMSTGLFGEIIPLLGVTPE